MNNTIIVFKVNNRYSFRTEHQALPAGAIVVAIAAATLINNELSTDYKYLWINELFELDPIGSNFTLVIEQEVEQVEELDK